MKATAPHSLRLKRLLSAVASAAMLASSLTPWHSAVAGTVRIGGGDYHYTSLSWSTLSSGGTSGAGGSGNAIYEGQNISYGNRTALALGLTAAQAPAPTAAQFPGNVPYALARYNPYTQQLRIDIWKVERAGGGARLMHAVFAPRHGSAWQAARAYISPGAYSGGHTAGVNPFASFNGGDIFTGISLAGAKVALGHAMRLSGAGSGLLAMPDTRLSQVTRRSGSLFKKRIDTWIYGHIKTRWWLAFPGDGLDPSAWSGQSAICATSPTATSCPRYATAVSGATFQEVEGGNLNSTEDTWQLDHQRRSGLTILGGIMFAHLTGGLSNGTTGMGAGLAPMFGAVGAYRADRDRPRVPQPPAVNGDQIAEPSYVPPGNGGLAGGSPGSLVNANPGALGGSAGTASGRFVAAAPSRYQGMLMGHMPSVINTPTEPTLKGVREAVYGSPTYNGMVPEVGQHVESNHVQFVRDADGRVLRDLGD